MERSYADRADSATNFDPEMQFDKDIDFNFNDLGKLETALARIDELEAQVDRLKYPAKECYHEEGCPHWVKVIGENHALKAQLAAALMLVRGAYSEGFSEGMREHTTSRGGKTWQESSVCAAFASLPAPEAAPVPASVREALQTTSEGKYWTSQYNACWDHSKAESLRSASQKALNYIENTEGELGITLSCGDALRDALASLPAHQED